jgi:predicted nucleic acid-binding protein
MPFAPALPDTLLVLDTCTLTEWRYQLPGIKREIQAYTLHHNGMTSALTSITVFEALHGFQKESLKTGRPTERDKADLETTKRLIKESSAVLPFNERAAEIAAYVFPRLTRTQRSDNLCDLLIAATALSHGYGVATSDRSDFGLIGQKISDDYPLLYLAIWKQ